MNNINITDEQEMMLRNGCCDCMLVTEFKDIRLIAMVDGDEDFDGAMEEFNRRIRDEHTTTINDVLLFIISLIAFLILITI